MKVSIKKVSRIAAYGLLVTAIIYTTVVLVAIGQGYSFNWRTGQLEGGGLLVVESQPAGATVKLDGAQIKKSTPLRLSLKAGSHTLELSREGYRTWQKDFSITKAQVTWLRYPLLVPKKLEPVNISSAKGLSNFQQTPDRRFLSWVTGSSSSRIEMLEIGSESRQPQVVYQMPSAQVRQGAKIVSTKWAQDSQHLLVVISRGENDSYLIVNKDESEDVINLETEFKTQLGNLQFHPTNWQQLYWLNKGNLRRLDLENKNISSPLSKNIKNYLIYQEELFIFQARGSARQIIKLDKDNNSKVIVDNLAGNSYEFEYLGFGEQKQLAVLDVAARRVSLYDPNSESQQASGSFETVAASSLDVSPDGRLLLMRDKNEFATYDLDQERLYRFSVKGQLAAELSWVDNYHLLGKNNAQAVIFEFDGHNLQPLLNTASGSAVFSSKDKQEIYFITKTADTEFSINLLPL